MTGRGRHGTARRMANVGTLAIAMLLLAACGLFRDEPDRPDHWSPFHSQSIWWFDNGSIYVALNGFARGHEPGRAAEFQVVIENRTDEQIAAPICIHLVDEYSVIQELGELEVDLPPGAAGVRPFLVDFDDELLPRAYGLALIIGDFGSIVHTVRLGIADDEVRPWVDASELTCDP
jgi:hypothetical protein